MDPRLIELALKKQRLQFRAASQREDMAHRLEAVESVLDRVDAVRDQLAWAKDKAPLLSVGALVLLAARPRLTLRIAKRTWLAWLLVRRVRGGSSSLLPVALPALHLALSALKRVLSRGAKSG
jgi:hypothetical protein